MFPPDLFSIAVETFPWGIIHVHSRQEKAIARLLCDRKQPFYLPQIEKTHPRNGRTFTSFLPLFPGYVFVRRTPALREVLWASRGVARSIPVDDQELLTSELQQVRRLQESGAIFAPAASIGPGAAVRITEGVFEGYTGTVLRERGVVRLVVSITAVHRSVVAEFRRGSVALLGAV